MKPVTHIISDESDLETLIQTFDLKPATTIQAVCEALLSAAKEEQVQLVYIKVTQSLLKRSYVLIPAMLARSMEGQSDYPSLQSYRENGYVVVRAGDARRAATFGGRAVQAIRKHGKFKAPINTIPASYRDRPQMMTYSLQRITGYTIATVANEKFILWKRVDNQT